MEMNEETCGLFDRRLLGNLSSDEKAAFEKELGVNKSLKDEFLWMNEAVNEIRMAGKTILKKQLAEIGATIPASAFEKYSPSIKSSSFFKKWWWAIATVSVALAIAVTWFVLHQHVKKDVQPEEKPVIKASTYDRPTKDSSMKPVAPLVKQTISSFGADTNSDVLFSDDNCVSFVVSFSPLTKNSITDNFIWPEKETTLPRADTSSLQNVDMLYTGQSVTTTVANITVECCQQSAYPAYYIYSDHLTIASTYADTTGLRFYQNGNSIIMTDGKPGYFLLVKNEKEQALVKVNENLQKEVKRMVAKDSVAKQPAPKKGKNVSK